MKPSRAIDRRPGEHASRGGGLPRGVIDQLEHEVGHGFAAASAGRSTMMCCQGSTSITSSMREAVGAELVTDLADAHLVLLADRHARVLAAELDQHQAPARLERRLQLAHERLRRRQLVIDVDHQQQVEGLLRQHRIVGAALHELDVAEPLAGDAGAQEIEHARLQVGGDDAAGRRRRPWPAAPCSSRIRRRCRRRPRPSAGAARQSPSTALPRARAPDDRATPRPSTPIVGASTRPLTGWRRDCTPASRRPAPAPGCRRPRPTIASDRGPHSARMVPPRRRRPRIRAAGRRPSRAYGRTAAGVTRVDARNDGGVAPGPTASVRGPHVGSIDGSGVDALRRWLSATTGSTAVAQSIDPVPIVGRRLVQSYTERGRPAPSRGSARRGRRSACRPRCPAACWRTPIFARCSTSCGSRSVTFRQQCRRLAGARAVVLLQGASAAEHTCGTRNRVSACWTAVRWWRACGCAPVARASK